ncbi:Pyridoxamine 5'-phosphate oxidase [Pedococcus dokdonensis]|uniref:Pyridoxamine 5'-phosphate oxidase n=1 Tax=Pedococcus dokdonensis TaxID=443156 RepID=A0A1H0NAM7_9MICO|nr:pyridoxamine 5'-phosphate oxidase family protein [Pedococcus dokdonensis]SDO89708.1 Pyridoxamine 5'-phosphate oxidase [Pedococcus dokdonensis]
MAGDIRPTDHTGLRVLDLDECLARLVEVPVGRFAFQLDGELTVLPVVHTLDGIDVCFRTTGDSKIQAAVDHDRVAFEVDQFDARTRTGWSVLVQGTATVVDDDEDVRRLDRVARVPWVPPHEAASTWVRVRTQSITGRALV